MQGEVGFMPKVSVIVPVYKIKEDYLNACVKSVLEQTLDDFELILVDDGSPDFCGEICDLISRQDSRVTVVHQENKGVSSARNAGMSLAKGGYILFLDADDTLQKNAFVDLYQSAQNSDTDVVLFNYRQNEIEYHLFDGFNIECLNESQLEDIYFSTLLPRKKEGILLCGVCCKFYKREFIEKENIKFEDNISSAEDQLFFLACLNAKPSISYCAEPFYEYRYVKDSASFSYTKGFSEQVLNYARVLKSLLMVAPAYIPETYFSTRICQCVLYTLSKDFFHKDNIMSRRERKRLFNDFMHEKTILESLLTYKKDCFTLSERLGLQMCKYGLFSLINLASKRW